MSRRPLVAGLGAHQVASLGNPTAVPEPGTWALLGAAARRHVTA